MDINNLKLTPEEEEQLKANRKEYVNSNYMKTVDDGAVYPIPKLVGAFRSILIDKDTVGAEDITLGFAKFEPGAYHEIHAHGDCEEVAYMISGRLVGGVCGADEDGWKEIIWEPGDVLFVPRGGKHWFYNPFNETQRHVFLYTRPSLATAGYSLGSEGFKEIGSEVEKEQAKK
jgi:uncharacterized RmlC-like cupin family protein